MTNKQLLEIIKKALKGEKYNKKIENEKEVLVQADTNALIPLLFSGVEKDVFSLENYERLKKRFLANVYNDDIQKKIIFKINEIFNENKIDHLFLKGTHLKNVYSESFYRPMGDIDVLIKKDKITSSRVIFKKEDFKNYSRTAEHDVYLYNDYYVEVHRDIYQTENNNDKSSLLRPWDYAIIDNNYQYRFDYAFEAVYLLYHLKKHVLSSGIGLRSVLDISVFLAYYEKEINKETLNKLLKENNLEVFFQTILYINDRAFGVNTIFLDEDFSLEIKDYEEILNYISSSGTHGKGGNINLMAPRVAKKGKFITFLKLIFPKWSFMIENYPWLKYLPFLLPVAYIIRGLKHLFFKTKYTFKKIKSVNTAQKEAEELENVFTKMGL